MKKSRVKKNKKNNSNIFKIIGIIALILIIVISIIIFLNKNSSSDKKTDKIVQTSECLAIDLKISEINPTTNILKITRPAGSGISYQIQISVNGNKIDNLFASDIKEGATKIFLLNTNPGDKVEIAPILKDGTICSVSDTKVA